MSRYLNYIYVPHVRLHGGDPFDACHNLVGTGSDASKMRKSVLSKLRNSDLESTEPFTTLQIFEQIAHYIEDCRLVLIDETNMTMRGVGIPWHRARKRAIIVETDEAFTFYTVSCYFAFHARLIHYACRVDGSLSISRIYVGLYSCVFVFAFFVSCTVFAFTGLTVIKILS